MANSAPTLIAPWLAAGSVTLVFGPPSSGKTMLTSTLVHALAHGATLWGAFPCLQSRVLVVQADMNNALYQARLRPSAARFTEDVTFLVTDALPFDVCGAHTATHPAVLEAQTFMPDVVFVDTLRKTHTFDENDSAAPDRVYAAWRLLFPGAALVFLHHTRKVSTMPAASQDATIREAFRGTTAWAASADTLLMVKRVRRANNPLWMTRVFFVRTRSCEEPPPMLLRLTDELLLEPVAGGGIERQLLVWLVANPRAGRTDAVKWLTSLQSDAGEALCSQATAYRVWDRVVKGEA